MPAKSPRLSVSISPEMAHLLSQLSEVSGQSASSLVREFLEEAAPALSRMLQLLEAARSAKGAVREGLGGALDRVVTDLQDAYALAEGRMAITTRDLVAEAQAVKGRKRGGGLPRGSAAAPAVASTPVPVTRGSGSGKTRKPSNSRGGRS
jgi:predicted DNA-binding protein